MISQYLDSILCPKYNGAINMAANRTEISRKEFLNVAGLGFISLALGRLKFEASASSPESPEFWITGIFPGEHIRYRVGDAGEYNGDYMTSYMGVFGRSAEFQVRQLVGNQWILREAGFVQEGTPWDEGDIRPRLEYVPPTQDLLVVSSERRKYIVDEIFLPIVDGDLVGKYYS